MFTAIVVTLLASVVLGYAPWSGHAGQLITRRPYNNRYSDASGAREDHLG
jgi:hypothetical protein